MVFTRHDLIKTIMGVADMLKSDPSMKAQYDELLWKQFLKVASETPGNLECVEHVEYGKVSEQSVGPSEVYGLKVRGKNTLLSSIAWRLESEQGIDLVLSNHPELTRADAAAALRTLTVLLYSLDADVLPDA
jgi:hypothetical protein